MIKHGDHSGYNTWHTQTPKQYVEPAKVTKVRVARMPAAQPVVPVCIRKYLKRFSWGMLGFTAFGLVASLALLLGAQK